MVEVCLVESRCVRVEGGSRGGGREWRRKGWEQRKAARQGSPSGPRHVGEAGDYEGLKHFC